MEIPKKQSKQCNSEPQWARGPTPGLTPNQEITKVGAATSFSEIIYDQVIDEGKLTKILPFHWLESV